MISMSENLFRDYLYENHKDSLSSLIVGRKKSIEWDKKGFQTIQFLLQQRAENKINEILDGLESLILTAKEMRLERNAPHPTRIDLFGSSDRAGVTIIELKKSEQTERQSFTELLAYSNHFCSIFPGLNESAITSILIAPMKTRTAKDAYVQELVFNSKNILALIPRQDGDRFTLEVFYPESLCYSHFESNILNDSSMMCVALEFPLMEGWIDSDLKSEDGDPPQYSVDALNSVANSIAQRLAVDGFHALIYASQKWGNIASDFANPNVIVVAAINPFSAHRTEIHADTVCGDSSDARIEQIQAIYDQFSKDSSNGYWVREMESYFYGRLIRSVDSQFKLCMLNKNNENIWSEISCPDWHGLKNNFFDSVYVHNFNLYSTGLLREIYLEYMKHIFETGFDVFFYNDDVPMYSYQMLTPFFPAWEIFSGLGSRNRLG